MAEPNIAEVFGANASQTETELTISKADLSAVGLTAEATNSAESLLASILLLAKEMLTPETFDTNADQSTTIEPGFNSIVTKTTDGTPVEYRQFQYNVNFHKLDNVLLDPDDL